MIEELENGAEQLYALGIEYGLQVLGAILVLIFGFWIAGRVRAAVRSTLLRLPNFDNMLAGFFGSVARYLVLAITLLAVLGQFGIETTSLVALIGAAGLAVGLALQGTLSNVAAGVMLLLFRPFKLGDYVEVAGTAGTVKDLTLFTTELATPDNVQIIVPNGDVWGSAVKNYSFHATRRIDLVFGISYSDDINKALAAMTSVAQADGRIHKDPAPLCVVTGLGDSSVDLLFRVWCASGDYWDLTFEMQKVVKERFDSDGISIPFPTRTIIQEAAD